MPTYEYFCRSCESEFEELLIQSDEIKKYSEWHPCPSCGNKADRMKVSIMNFAFKAPAGQTSGSGVHGQSGVHDLDYPSIDKAVGRSAAKRWKGVKERKAERDKIRRESGTNMITEIGGKPKPLDPKVADLRSKAMVAYNNTKKSDGSDS